MAGLTKSKVRADVSVPKPCNPIGNTSLRDMMTKSGIANLVKNNQSITFGDQKISPDKLKNITYTGTIADWNNIDKYYDWDRNIPTNCVIRCTDGSIDKE